MDVWAKEFIHEFCNISDEKTGRKRQFVCLFDQGMVSWLQMEGVSIFGQKKRRSNT